MVLVGGIAVAATVFLLLSPKPGRGDGDKPSSGKDRKEDKRPCRPPGFHKAAKKKQFLLDNGFQEDGSVKTVVVAGLRYAWPFNRQELKEGRRGRSRRKKGSSSSNNGSGTEQHQHQPEDEEQKGPEKPRATFKHLDRPVRAGALEILPCLRGRGGEGIIAVNKPVPMPVQRGGCYNRNNLQNILREQLDPTGKAKLKLMILNRLDICTSGICMLAADTKAGTRVSRDIAERRVQKTYLARVEGVFPATASCDKDVDKKAALTHFVRVDEGDTVHGGTTDHTFRAWDGSVHTVQTSLVMCLPKTGRNHQIRIHLEALGHPILNDVDHGGRDVGMPDPYGFVPLSETGGDGGGVGGARGPLIGDTGTARLEATTEALREMIETSGDDALREVHLPAFEGGRLGQELEHAASFGLWRSQHVWTRGIWLHAWKYEHACCGVAKKNQVAKLKPVHNFQFQSHLGLQFHLFFCEAGEPHACAPFLLLLSPPL